jgi:hypothetical protein
VLNIAEAVACALDVLCVTITLAADTLNVAKGAAAPSPISMGVIGFN